MAKAVHFDVEARQGLKRGIDIVSRSVRITLGVRVANGLGAVWAVMKPN